MAGVEEVAVREGRIASTASQRGDTRHEKRPHGWRTGHDAGADVKHTDVVFGVFVRGSHARESDDREETGQASWLEVFGVERGRRGTSRGGARACKDKTILRHVPRSRGYRIFRSRGSPAALEIHTLLKYNYAIP